MNRKGLVSTLAATALVVSYATYDYVVETRRTQMQEEGSRVLKIEPDQIKEVEILTKGITESVKAGEPLLSNKIKLVRTSEGWKMEEPIQELADQNSVREFVEGLTAETASEVVVQGNSIDWKVFGLDEPRGQIAITNNLGERKTFLVSSKKNYQGDAFLREDQENKVLLSGSTWFSKLEKKPLDFRDKRLLRKPISEVSRLIVVQGAQKFSLKLKDNIWFSEENPTVKLDQSRVRDVLAILTNPVITEFMKESEASREELTRWGFDKLRSRIKLEFQDQSLWSIDLARNSEVNNFVQMSEPFLIAKIQASDAEKLASLSLDSLRDRREPFLFSKGDVRKLMVETPKGKSEFELKESKWQLVSKTVPELSVDSEKVDDFLNRLGGLEVARFLDRKENIQTHKGGRVVLKNADDQVLLAVEIGDTHKIKVNGQERTQALVQSSLFPQTVTLDISSLKALRLGELVAPLAAGETPVQAPAPQFVEPGGHHHDH